MNWTLQVKSNCLTNLLAKLPLVNKDLKIWNWTSNQTKLWIIRNHLTANKLDPIQVKPLKKLMLKWWENEVKVPV